MVQYLELVLKRDFTSGWSGWRHAAEKLGLFFKKTFEEPPKDKTEKLDWTDKLAKNGY